MKTGVTILRDRTEEVLRAVRDITKKELLIGVPQQNAERSDSQKISNAAIGYIHEFGVPSRNIPARPHLVPGVEKELERILRILQRGAEKALEGEPDEVERAQNKAGMVAVSSVKGLIQARIAPPLKPATIRGRWNRQKSRRGKPMPENFADEAVPLINTGAYIRSITYVIREAE